MRHEAGVMARLVAGALALLLANAAVGVVPLEETSDLEAEGQLAEQRGLPILLMFSAQYCSYCKVVKEEFLQPMLISGEYEDKVLIRTLHIDDPWAEVNDFDGNVITIADLTLRYGVSVTPTVIFLDGCGRPLSEKIVGITTRDYYGGFLDEGITVARRQLDEMKALAAADAPPTRRCAVRGEPRRGDAG